MSELGKQESELEKQERYCLSCRQSKKELLYVEIGDFEGSLCPRCYTIKMLEEICEKIGIENFYSAEWIKRKGDDESK